MRRPTDHPGSTSARHLPGARCGRDGPAAVRRRRHRGGLPADQPAVHDRGLVGLVGVIPVPMDPADRPDDQHHLVLGRPALHRLVQHGRPARPGDHRDGDHAGRAAARLRAGLVAVSPRPGLPVAAGVRGNGLRVPAVQQGALAPVRALVVAVLRAAADPGRLDPGLLRRRRRDREQAAPDQVGRGRIERARDSHDQVEPDRVTRPEGSRSG